MYRYIILLYVQDLVNNSKDFCICIFKKKIVFTTKSKEENVCLVYYDFIINMYVMRSVVLSWEIQYRGGIMCICENLFYVFTDLF